MDLHFSADDLQIEALDDASKFDRVLRAEWHKAMQAGYFRYTLDSMRIRVVPGKKNFIIQHNVKRFAERRQPIAVTALDQPFDPEKFNFNKVASREIIFNLCFSEKRNCHGNNIDEATSSRIPVLINVAPMDDGHVLIVPDPSRCFNQVFREEVALAGLRMIHLSHSRYFYGGYNSLCAFASVNHLHIHGWYTNHELYASIAELKSLEEKYSLFTFKDYPVNGFVFALHNTSHIVNASKLIANLAGYLHNSNIAHNILFCRGPIPVGSECKPGFRVCIWPRRHSYHNDKGTNPFNIAVAELSGLLICKNEDDYLNMNEATIYSEVSSVRLPDDDFNQLIVGFLKHLEKSMCSFE